MFESLKKKFSRTSEKLEEELIEEAEAEDNLQEEEGTRFSFFSFGKKKEEEEDESNLLPEAEEVSQSEEEPEEIEDEDDLDEENKSGFLSRFRSGDDSESEEDEDIEEEDGEEENKSGFLSRFRSGDDSESEEDEETEEDGDEEEKSHFWSRNKKDKEDISADGEASGGLFSFVREKTIQEKHVEDILFELEMELLQGDVAMEVATEVVESVKESLVGKKIKRSNDITEYTFIALRDAVAEIIDSPGKSMT